MLTRRKMFAWAPQLVLSASLWFFLLSALVQSATHGIESLKKQAAQAATINIFVNGNIDSGYADSSWCSSPKVAFTTVVATASGARARVISFTPNNYCGVQLYRKNYQYLTLSPYASITMLLHGGPKGGQKALQAGITDSNGVRHATPLAKFLPGNSLPANRWTRVTVPLTAFGGVVTKSTKLLSFYIQADAKATQPLMYIDGIQILPLPNVTPAPTPTPATPRPTARPTATPQPTARPTATPTRLPTRAPTPAPTAQPTASPTLRPTPSPTRSAAPTAAPTATPVSGGTQRLYTSGNAIFTADGRRWRARGVNIMDPRFNSQCYWLPLGTPEVIRRIDAAVAWGVNLFRLVLENHGDEYDGFSADPDYLPAIQSIAQHVGARHPGVYVMVSLWQDPTFTTETAKTLPGWPTAATNARWAKLAPYFKGMPHVLFGVVNEPQSNYDGAFDAACWEAMNSAVAAIRAAESAAGDSQHLIAVQGTRAWARYLNYYVSRPITAGNGSNVIYETHPYNHEADFDSLVTEPAARLPVIVGEFGPALVDGENGKCGDPVTQTMAESVKLMKLAESLQVPYAAWSFSEQCDPSMLLPAMCAAGDPALGCHFGGSAETPLIDLKPNEWGLVFKQHLATPYGSA